MLEMVRFGFALFCGDDLKGAELHALGLPIACND